MLAARDQDFRAAAHFHHGPALQRRLKTTGCSAPSDVLGKFVFDKKLVGTNWTQDLLAITVLWS